jgi:hypothetical protein
MGTGPANVNWVQSALLLRCTEVPETRYLYSIVAMKYRTVVAVEHHPKNVDCLKL